VSAGKRSTPGSTKTWRVEAAGGRASPSAEETESEGRQESNL
jgi:hypothetical protein